LHAAQPVTIDRNHWSRSPEYALTFVDLTRIETALDDLSLPWAIDLSLISHIDNPDLLAHIARVGKPLWERENGDAGTRRV